MNTYIPSSYLDLKIMPWAEAWTTYRAMHAIHVDCLQQPLDWEELFGNRCPVCIEYCSGNGHWIVEQARMAPTKNWIAVEWDWSRATRILAKRDRAQLHNLMVICAEARTVTRKAIPSNSVDGIWVHFPDPWPKRRHTKHRLLAPDFAAEWHRILKSEKQVILATDHAPSIKDLVSCSMDISWWKPIYPAPYYEEASTYAYSTFADLWQKQARPLYITQWTKRAQGIPKIHMEGQTVRYIPLDCGLRSSLKWDVDVGLPILWHLQGGELTDEGEIRAFEIAIDEWARTQLPRHSTLGVVLYQGRPPITVSTLRSLAARLPEGIDPFLMVDLSGDTTEEAIRALRRDELPGFRWILQGFSAPYAFPFMGWNQDSPWGVYGKGVIMPELAVNTAICYGETANWRVPRAPCRLIPESLITEEWDQLDRILAFKPSLLTQRALNGFQAAGGEVMVNPPQEIVDQLLETF